MFKKLPRYYDKRSPSRKNGPLTPLGYTQFYLPDIDTNHETAPEWQVEYSTFKLRKLFPNQTEDMEQPPPVPLHLLPGFEPALLADQVDGETQETREKRVEAFMSGLKRITPFKMKDLTIGSYIKLARELVAVKKMWNKFSDLM